jgi:predicted HicB family RNase H-like nuclease
MGSKYTEAQKAASIKYLREKTDSIQIRTPKGTKDRWKAAAEEQGISLQQFIIQAVEAAIDKEPEA